MSFFMSKVNFKKSLLFAKNVPQAEVAKPTFTTEMGIGQAF